MNRSTQNAIERLLRDFMERRRVRLKTEFKLKGYPYMVGGDPHITVTTRDGVPLDLSLTELASEIVEGIRETTQSAVQPTEPS